MDSPVEMVAVVFGFLYVVLVMRQSVWCWPVGLIDAALFAWVFLEARLYAATGLQFFFAAVMIYGWWEWLHGGEGGGALVVARMPRQWWVVLGPLAATLALGFGFYLHDYTDAALPFWDAGAASFSLVAQFMTARKWLENWLVWLSVDAVYIGVYALQGLYPTAGLYVAFLALAVLGFRTWRRALQAVGPAAEGPV